ncbi:MAG: IS3 family transposase [Lutimonas sp.]
MIRPKDKTLSIRKQCDILSVPRSSLYYQPVPEKPENIKMMQIMDKHLLVHPTEGVLSMVDMLKEMGHPVGPKRIRRLFGLMGHQTIYRKKNLTRGALKEFIKPYLLRGMKISHANQVWSTDITYIPMAKGFMYLTAIMDVYSRKIVGWGISNSMSKQWVLSVLKDAIARHGKPEIINTDQGSQYTSHVWTHYLEQQEIQISMDGKGRATDNIWIERFWKSIKYNHIYLNPYDNGLELFEGIKNYIEYYNQKKHQTIKRKPNDAYSESICQKAA